MKTAPHRPDELAALDALRALDVLDSESDAEFDALAQAASIVCGTPISLITLIDADRQWFKANVGLPGVSQTSRDLAFCAHAVLGDSVFEVPDAREDLRFVDNPLVTGDPKIRFYASMPLQLGNGHRVGALCVIDREPRHLDEAQRQVLERLGLAAAKALESRRLRRELAAWTAAGARASLVEQHSADAIIGLDAAGRVTRWNPAAETLFGWAAAEMLGGTLDAVTPRVRSGEEAGVLLRIADGRAHTYDTVRLHRSGKAVEVSVTAVPEFDAEGRVSGTTKFVRDISERVRAAREQAENEARARRMYESTPAMLHSVDHQGRLIAVSDQWLDKLGYRRCDVIGRSAPDLLTPGSRERSLKTVLPKLFAEGRIDNVEYQIVRQDGQVLDVLLSAIVDYGPDGQPVNSLSVMEDVTERRRAERELHTARRDLQSILDAMPSRIAYWDRHGVNRFANRAYEAWLGFGPDGLRGQQARVALGEALFELNRPQIEAALRGQAQSFERSYPGLREGMRHTLVHYTPDVVAGQVEGFYVYAHDVSEIVEGRQRLAAAQRETEALLRTLNQHAIVSVADRSGRITEVNDAFCGISGYSREELIGQDHRHLNSGQHEPGFWAQMWRTVAGGQPWRGEVCNRAKDGSLYWVNSLVAPFMGADGRIEKYVSIRNDITAAKRVEQRLRSSEALLDRAGRIAGVGGWEVDLRLQTVQWSAQTRRIHEVEPDFVPDLSGAIGFYAPEARREIEQVVQAGIEQGKPWDVEVPLVTAKGRRIWVRAVGTAESENGSTVRLVGTFQDITERKRTEDELRHTLTLLRSVLEASTQVAIIAVEPDGMVSLFNRGAEQMLGYSAAEVVGRETALTFHDSTELRRRAGELSQRFGRKVHTGLALTEPEVLNEPHEWSYQRKDGGVAPVSLAVTAMRDDDGRLVGYLGVAHDISARIAHEKSLRDAVHKAEAASRAKSSFLANMSHEIRTPMNAVIDLSYLLARTPLDAEQADTLDKIKLASRSLLSIINDVLDLSKIEASEMKLECAPFLLGNVLSELTALSRLQADAKGVGFAVQLLGDLPPAVEGDATRLRQVLTNLISNAIKFTERGQVRLSVRQLAGPPGQARLRFVVQDSGIGIEAAALERLFVPFVQADTSTTRRFGGTGLGLSIVRQLAMLMGGQVGVNSTPGVGSEFWVEVDFGLCDASAAATLQPVAAKVDGPRLQGVRALVTDDNAINLEVARRILELEGATVTLAHHGQQAVELLLAQPQGFDVVLMDVQMPVLDGHDATRRIRSGLGLTRLPVIALTAGISTGEHERAAAAGMNDVVPKPFDPPALVDCIRKYVRVAEPAAAEPAGLPATQSATQSAWPLIDGIDADEARSRLGGDVELFGSLLRRLLGDFADLMEPGDDTAGPTLAQLPGRLHNLKGSAGTLAATSLAQSAARAEQALRAGDRSGEPGGSSALLRPVAQALRALKQAAAPTLAAWAASEDAGQEVDAGPLDTAALDELLRRLKSLDLGAMEGFRTLSPQLHARLGRQAFTALREQIDNLRFAEAASALEEQFRAGLSERPRGSTDVR